MKTLFILMTLILITPAGFASTGARNSCQGFTTMETLLEDRSVFAGDCTLHQELTLGRTQKSYPEMDNATLRVDYWQGSYSRIKKVEQVYQVDVYSCRGQLQKSFQKMQKYDFKVIFEVENPNLRDDVSTSYAANAPMTDEEALAEFARARSRCETANTQ
jgi:hypothetical protein